MDRLETIMLANRTTTATAKARYSARINLRGWLPDGARVDDQALTGVRVRPLSGARCWASAIPAACSVVRHVERRYGVAGGAAHTDLGNLHGPR